MFAKNDVVVYGRTGICTVESIEKKSYSMKNGTGQMCYVLKPLYDTSSTVFVPVDNDTLTGMMRSVLTKGEIDSMLDTVKEKEEIWIEDQRERTAKFREVLSHGIKSELLVMIRSLYDHKTALTQSGKKLCASDDGILKDAKREVSQEFAYALGIDQSGVEPYITERLGC